ncbi:MAG: cytochrome P450 [Chloroflexota bacterium]
MLAAVNKQEIENKPAGCPYHGAAQITGDHVTLRTRPIEQDGSGVWQIRSYTAAKAILRSNGIKQAGFQAETIGSLALGKEPMLYLDGAEHHQLRKQTARFFTPKAVKTYDGMIGRFVDQMLDELRTAGKGDLSKLTMKLAVLVAAEVVGLTNSHIDGLSRRLGKFFEVDPPAEPAEKFSIIETIKGLWGQIPLLSFYWFDVRPAIRNRQSEPQDDLISYLLTQEYTSMQILTECLLFGAAGMATTREFISAAALHFLQHDQMRADYLAADVDQRHAMLREILRLEPVVGELSRRATKPLTLEVDGQTFDIPEGDLIRMNVYGTNLDEHTFGDDPELVCPHRELARGVHDAGMSFGDGHHRCPGAYIAIEETDIFLTRFLQMDGLRLVQEPTIKRNEVVKGYEIREFMVRVD